MRKSTLFGIPMDGKTKAVIILCGILAVFCILFYILLCFVPNKEEIVVELPGGGLSQSVFDSQNMEYVSVNGFDEVHSFEKIPFTIDTVSGQRADIGDGAVYASAPYYFYYSEIKHNEDMEDTVKKELTDVLVLSADSSLTQIECIKEESGYVNGCEAIYYLLKVSVNSEKEPVEAYLSIYRLHINDVLYKSDIGLLVGCMACDMYSTEGLEALQTLSYSAITTLRYSKELEKEQSND